MRKERNLYIQLFGQGASWVLTKRRWGSRRAAVNGMGQAGENHVNVIGGAIRGSTWSGFERKCFCDLASVRAS